MAPDSPIRPYTSAGRIGLSQDSLIKDSRLSSGLRVRDPSSDDGIKTSLSRTIVSSGTDRSIGSAYSAKRRENLQAARNLENGAGILELAAGAVDALRRITLEQLALVEKVDGKVLSSETRQQISDQVTALAQDFDSVLSGTTFNSQNVFGRSFSLNTGSSAGFEFRAGDSLNRVRIEATGTRATADGAVAQRTEFDFTAVGLAEESTLTFLDADAGSVVESMGAEFQDASVYAGGESFVFYDADNVAHTFQIVYDVGDPANGDVIISAGFTDIDVAFAARTAFQARGFNDFSIGATALASVGNYGPVTDAYSNAPTITVSTITDGRNPDLFTDSTLVVGTPGGGTHTFVFAVDGDIPTLPGTVIDINSDDDDTEVAAKVEIAINAAGIGVTASINGGTPTQVDLVTESKTNVTDAQLNVAGSHTASTAVQGTPVAPGAFITFSSLDADYTLYFSVDGVGAAPGADVDIPVAVASTDSVEDIIAAAAAALEAQAGEVFSVEADATSLTITAKTPGNEFGPPGFAGDNFVATVLQDGSDSEINSSTDRITLTSHPFSTGDAVTLYSGGELPTGTEEGTLYYVIKVDADNVKLASSAANAAAGTAIDLTDEGAGGLTLTKQNIAGATTSSTSLTFDLTDDVEARAAFIEIASQLQRVTGELDRLSSLGNALGASHSILSTSAAEHGKRAADFNFKQISEDTENLSSDIPRRINEALGAHDDLDPLTVLQLLSDDDEEEDS